MQNWARLTGALETALTLDRAAADAFLDKTFEAGDTLDLARRLMARACSGDHFMRTATDWTADAEPADDVAPSLPAGMRIGVWAIDALIGRGGMGEVYRAHRADGLFEQTVALKLIHGEGGHRAERFANERRRLAQMQHPGIAGILDGGNAPDGRAYMVMEFVDGTPIDRHAAEAGLGRAGVLALFSELCSAVAHAHGRLVLHRDIKPGNVLVDRSGAVRLIDFGIASGTDGDDPFGPALTLASAAPEQLRGEPVTVQTDIFALGVLAHRLLTGRQPERRADGGMTIDRVHLSDADLAAILDRAMAVRLEARYASVDALSEDVRAWLGHWPVAARGGGRAYRIARFLRRYPLASAFGSLALAALIIGLAVSLKFASDSRREAARANAELMRAEFFLQETAFSARLAITSQDLLLRLFDGEAAEERQRTLLLQYWEGVWAAREDDPEAAALAGIAIGNHFSIRGDDVTARAVLEPVIEAGLGSDFARRAANVVGGYVHASLGEDARAANLLRQAERDFAASYSAHSYEHAAAAAWLARTSRDQADIDHAIAVSQRLLDSADSVEHKNAALNYLSAMHRLAGDLDGGYQAARQVYELYAPGQLGSAENSGVYSVTLAGFELYHRGDLDAADALVAEVLAASGRDYPVNLQTGRAHLIAGDAALMRGEPAGAQAHLDQALILLERFAGTDQRGYVHARFSLAESHAALGEKEAAKALLDAVTAALPEGEHAGIYRDRAVLSAAILAVHADGAEAGRLVLDAAPPDPDRLARELELAGKLKQLAALGIPVAMP